MSAAAAQAWRSQPVFAKLERFISTMGGMTVLFAQSIKRTFHRPFRLGDVAFQIETLGIHSLSIAMLTATFAGLVISLQFAFFLAKFGVTDTVGKVVSLTLFRELIPVLVALTVGGRIGSGITAELGSMKVTEQIDAMRAMGADPIRRLVTPRVLACGIVMPLLTVLADIIGLVAGALVVRQQHLIPLERFFKSALTTVDLLDFGSGVFKSAVFGLIIAVAGCYKGLAVEGGTEGVGRATTQTVAITSVAVCLSDFLMTKFILAL